MRENFLLVMSCVEGEGSNSSLSVPLRGEASQEPCPDQLGWARLRSGALSPPQS